MQEWATEWQRIAHALEAGTAGADTVIRATMLLEVELPILETALNSLTEAVERNQSNRDRNFETLGRLIILEERVKGRRNREAVAIRQEVRKLKQSTLDLADEIEESWSTITDMGSGVLALRAMAAEIREHLDEARWQEAAARVRQYTANWGAWLKKHAGADGAVGA